MVCLVCTRIQDLSFEWHPADFSSNEGFTASVWAGDDHFVRKPENFYFQVMFNPITWNASNINTLLVTAYYYKPPL